MGGRLQLVRELGCGKADKDAKQNRRGVDGPAESKCAIANRGSTHLVYSNRGLQAIDPVDASSAVAGGALDREVVVEAIEGTLDRVGQRRGWCQLVHKLDVVSGSGNLTSSFSDESHSLGCEQLSETAILCSLPWKLDNPGAIYVAGVWVPCELGQ